MADATEAPAEEGVFSQQQAKLTCRFYKEEYPKNDEVVVAKVREIGEMGAYAKLLEYNGREGMILMSELSRRRIRSVNKLVRIGKDEYVVVLRADQEKGYASGEKIKTQECVHSESDLKNYSQTRPPDRSLQKASHPRR